MHVTMISVIFFMIETSEKFDCRKAKDSQILNKFSSKEGYIIYKFHLSVHFSTKPLLQRRIRYLM